MSDLEKEVEQYVLSTIKYSAFDTISQRRGHRNYAIECYIAGANSNYAKQRVIKGKIEVLDDLNDFDMYEVFGKIWRLRDELEAQLKQLETPNL